MQCDKKRQKHFFNINHAKRQLVIYQFVNSNTRWNVLATDYFQEKGKKTKYHTGIINEIAATLFSFIYPVHLSYVIDFCLTFSKVRVRQTQHNLKFARVFYENIIILCSTELIFVAM